jgi:hypothetical protein
MRRFLNKLFRDFRTTSTARGGRRAPRRASLQVECLEDRLVLTSASFNPVTSTLVVNASPGAITPPSVRQITFQADAHNSGKLQLLDNGVLVPVHDNGVLVPEIAIASIKNVDVNLASRDAVNVNDSNGLPFAAGTTISLSGSGLGNSLKLTGSRIISGGESYVAGSGTQDSLLTLGGDTFDIGAGVGSVTDEVKTTAALDVQSSAQKVSQTNGADGVGQTLSGLASGGAGDSLTYGYKNIVDLKLSSSYATANLNATRGAAGEQSFVLELDGDDGQANLNATPSTLTTDVKSLAWNASVQLFSNAGAVSVEGDGSTYVYLSQVVPNVGSTTAFINANVSVSNLAYLQVQDGGNHSTQENVKVTESTITGTGLFGNSAVKLTYSNVANLEIDTGFLANTYLVAPSHFGARFTSQITINSVVNLAITVEPDSGSGLNLTLMNSSAPASLFIYAPGGTFSPFSPNQSAGTEDVMFATGLMSQVSYTGFSSVSVSDGIPHA